MANNVTTYQDLISAKKELKQDIKSIEEDIKNSNIVKISNFFIKGKTLQTPSLDSIKIPHVKEILKSPIGNVVSSFLLSNKKIRKYFIAFVVVRETVPYALTEIKKLIDENK